MSTPIEGQRRSFDGHLCTVRYVGGLEGTAGDWLGVEWDDPTRGKHSGEHKGVRYFTCKSNYQTAGSFVRPSRPADPPRGFVEALREKYASEFEQELARAGSSAQKGAIEISGKVVEEVGFDKIRKQLAQLQELRIVLLDGMRVAGVLPSYDQTTIKTSAVSHEIQTTCPKITELDLSRSLLSRWCDVWEICDQLKQLKRLKLDGNRFLPLENDLVFEGIFELHLEETFLTWDEIAELTSRFPALTSLTASANQLTNISMPVTSAITMLTLEYNEICSISSVRHLTSLPNLQHLSLRGNNISTIHDNSSDSKKDDLSFSPTLRSLDLSRNNITTWTFLNDLPTLFPGLTTLRISGNPLCDQPPLPPSLAASITGSSKAMTVDEAFMLTLARLPSTLQTLNYSTISPQDRSNAEMYYLSLIGKELCATAASDEQRILTAHPRYMALCDLYGQPTVTRVVENDGSGKRVIHPRSVAARLVKMAFYVSSSSSFSSSSQQSLSRSEIVDMRIKEIPTSFDTYQVKALVSRLFGLPAYGFRLFWETDEWDPVDKDGGADTTTINDEYGESSDDDEEEEDDDEDDEEVGASGIETKKTAAAAELGNKSGFVRRQVELVDSTRDIGFLFQGEKGEMRIRVEVLLRRSRVLPT